MNDITKKTSNIAVALQYDMKDAPRVTAKGQGDIAKKIIETAKLHDIPIEDDPLLAQALSALPLDEEIPQELYIAVAEILNFVFQMRSKKIL